MHDTGTLQAIASSLGLSKTTISVALRGRPGVSEAVRAQILAEAKKLGYSPNPAAAELMAIVRARRKSKAGRTIAFINTIREDPLLMTKVRGLRLLFEGAEQQAIDFGYQIEEFKAFKEGMTPKRIDGILKARGIRGVIVGPRWMDEPEIVLDWPAYSCVLLGETTFNARIHRVCNHHAQGMELALAKMAELGYRRIGVELMQDYESVRHFDYAAGLTPARQLIGPSVRFFQRLRPHGQPTGLATRKASAASRPLPAPDSRFELNLLEKWVMKERLDAVVSMFPYDLAGLRQLKTSTGRLLGYARLDTEGCMEYAGINQHAPDIGRTAMEMLRSLLHSGERGFKPQPRIVLVEGEWIDGPSAPRVIA